MIDDDNKVEGSQETENTSLETPQGGAKEKLETESQEKEEATDKSVIIPIAENGLPPDKPKEQTPDVTPEVSEDFGSSTEMREEPSQESAEKSAEPSKEGIEESDPLVDVATATALGAAETQAEPSSLLEATSEAEIEANTEPEPESEPQTESPGVEPTPNQDMPDSAAESQNEDEARSLTEPENEVSERLEASSENQAESTIDADAANSKMEPDSETGAEPEPKPKPEPEPIPDPIPEPEPVLGTDPEIKSEVEPDSGISIETKQDLENVTETEAEAKTDVQKEEPQPESEFDDEDFTKYDREQSVALIKQLSHYEDVMRAERVLKRLRPRFDELRKAVYEDTLKAFLDGGGERDAFSYKRDELTQRFEANAKLIKDRKRKFLKEQDKHRADNLVKAEETLEKLRSFLNDPESSGTFKAFKELQNEWKSIGSLPGSQYRSLWANYNALVSRFYDTQSIYFELKELDRKKNLEIKLQLCEKAEALENIKELQDAIVELNELHNEFKHTGPVPLAEQDPVWERFKAASDKIYDRRKEFNAVLKKALNENYQKKSEIADKIYELTQFSSDRIKEWNGKTKEVLDLQKQWEAIGGLPRDKAKVLNKKFWGSFKGYFHNKNDFFKKLDGQRADNLKLKEELVKVAEELKNSEEWDKAASKFKDLQQKWRDIGPVPGKVRNEIYSKFKGACDYFFEKRREILQGNEKDFENNLKAKQGLVSKIQKLTTSKGTLDEFKVLQKEYFEIGFVPKGEVSNIQNEFDSVVNDFLKTTDLNEDEQNAILVESQIERIKRSPNADKKMHQKEQNIRKQISKIENDISVWQNNLEFFATSKNADKLKQDFSTKIDAASSKLNQLKTQLRTFASA